MAKDNKLRKYCIGS